MCIEIFKLFGSIFIDNEKANDSISKTDGKARSLMGTMGKGIATAAKWGVGIAVAAGADITATTAAARTQTEYLKVYLKVTPMG